MKSVCRSVVLLKSKEAARQVAVLERHILSHVKINNSIIKAIFSNEISQFFHRYMQKQVHLILSGYIQIKHFYRK